MDSKATGDTFETIVEVLQGSAIFMEMKKDLQKEIAKPHILHHSDMKKSLLTYLRESGWETKLQNAVYHEKIRHTPASIANPDVPPSHLKEPLGFIRKSQANWEKRIVKSINSMCTEMSIPLARKRSAADQMHMSSKFQTLASELDEQELEKIKPVYAPKDFFEAITSVENPNFNPLRKTPSSIKGWGMVKVNLYTKNLQELKVAFKELGPSQSNCGVDDAPSCQNSDHFESEWNKLGRKVIQNGAAPAARQYAKSGCPTGLRRQIWSQILGLSHSDIHKLYFEQLKQAVVSYDLLVDSLISKDIKITATNDADYFVFEDVLYQALLVFSRDTDVLRHVEQSSASPPKSYIRGKLGVQEYAVVYPPNGVIPFHGFSMYVAPLGYVCADVPQLYFLFKTLYVRYFSRLHTMSSHPQGILALCVLFENLLQTHEAGLFYHLKEVGAHPLRLVFNWIIYAFSGYIVTDQLLQLWDRIVAHDSLELLPVLAMAILSYRRSNLMEAGTLQAAQSVLADITTLNVVSLIQYVLFLKH